MARDPTRPSSPCHFLILWTFLSDPDESERGCQLPFSFDETFRIVSTGCIKKMVHSEFSLKSILGVGFCFFRGVSESEFCTWTIWLLQSYPLNVWNVFKTQKMHAQNEGSLLRPATQVMAELCRLCTDSPDSSECSGCPGELHWELKPDNTYSADYLLVTMNNSPLPVGIEN